ncbi:MAG: hypothetical protein H0W75_01945 [Chitinophagaceae bacterium]|nr:hypothetical protein [Chitinophagaceae bacterium]
MESKNLVKAGVLTLILVITSIASREIYLRSKGHSISYDDGEALWSDKRAQVYESSDKATVLIGSSRNKFDLDIDTWQSITGEEAIQLAIEGASPLPILHNLANDTKFRGKLLIDVTEGLFFGLSSPRGVRVKAALDYYKDVTPSQRFSFKVNHILESQFVFLDKDFFSLNALLQTAKIPPRKGFYGAPDFPVEFNKVTFARQSKMTPRFEADTTLQNQVKAIWTYGGNRINKPQPISQVDSILSTVKKSIDKIKARGGNIIFVRTPVSGSLVEQEKKSFPREIYWDRLLAITGCPGIHYQDYSAIANFQCPEFSHLKYSDAIIYTKNLIQIIEEKGWTFPNKQTSL